MISSLIKIPKIDFVGSWKSTELLFHRGNSSPKEPFHLDVQGFEFHKCSTSMAYADFFQEDWMWIEDGKPVKLFGMLTFCNLKSCKDAGFYCFFFLWSSRKIFCNDTMQRSWIWLRKPQAKRSIETAFFVCHSFLCGKTGGCRCQTCDSLWPQHQIRNWQIQWEGDQGALSTKPCRVERE